MSIFGTILSKLGFGDAAKPAVETAPVVEASAPAAPAATAPAVAAISEVDVVANQTPWPMPTRKS